MVLATDSVRMRNSSNGHGIGQPDQFDCGSERRLRAIRSL
jgi:hypothetical protein